MTLPTDDEIRKYVANHGTADERRKVANAWLGRPQYSHEDRVRFAILIGGQGQ